VTDDRMADRSLTPLPSDLAPGRVGLLHTQKGGVMKSYFRWACSGSWPRFVVFGLWSWQVPVYGFIAWANGWL
jgi:hypothetical protein